MHLSTHTSTVNFQSERNGEVDKVYFTIKSRYNLTELFNSTFDGPGNVSL